MSRKCCPPWNIFNQDYIFLTTTKMFPCLFSLIKNLFKPFFQDFWFFCTKWSITLYKILYFPSHLSFFFLQLTNLEKIELWKSMWSCFTDKNIEGKTPFPLAFSQIHGKENNSDQTFFLPLGASVNKKKNLLGRKSIFSTVPLYE